MAYATRRSYAGAAPSCTLTNDILSNTVSFSLTGDVTNWNTTASGPFYAVIDPGLATEEKILVAARSTTTLSSVTRGVDGTVPAAHSAGATCYPVFTAVDADQANAVASALTTKGDLLVTDGSVLNRLAVGTNAYSLLADSTSTNGVAWGQVAAAGIASDAVTTVKILDSAVTSAKIANATIVQGDLALTLLKALCPVGTINAYAGATAPTGWILCDGTAVVSGTHPELYALCATTPDLRGRFALGKTAAGTGSTLLGTGGSTTITTGNLPSHSHANTLTNNAGTFTGNSNTTSSTAHVHDVPFSLATTFNPVDQVVAIPDGNGTAFYSTQNDGLDGAHTHTVTPTGSVSTDVTITNASTGSGDAYNQPFVAVSYIIKHDYV